MTGGKRSGGILTDRPSKYLRTYFIGATVPAAGARHGRLTKEAMRNQSTNLPLAVTSLN